MLQSYAQNYLQQLGPHIDKENFAPDHRVVQEESFEPIPQIAKTQAENQVQKVVHDQQYDQDQDIQLSPRIRNISPVNMPVNVTPAPESTINLETGRYPPAGQAVQNNIPHPRIMNISRDSLTPKQTKYRLFSNIFEEI